MSKTLLTCVAVVLGCVGGVFAQTSPGEAAAKKLTEEVTAGLQRRNLGPFMDKYRAFTGKQLDASAGDKTFSDKTGNARLAWIDHLLRNPVESIGEAEVFTRELHVAAHDAQGIEGVLSRAAAKLDSGYPMADEKSLGPWDRVDPARRVAIASEAAQSAAKAIERMLAPLSAEELVELRENLYELSTNRARHGHRFGSRRRPAQPSTQQAPNPAPGSPPSRPMLSPDHGDGRRTTDLLDKLDRVALFAAAAALEPLTEPGFVTGLEKLDPKAELPKSVLIGSAGDDTHKLDELPAGVRVVIDLGGNDTYIEGATTAERPVLIVIDLAGNDTYRGERPGIQGAAVLGASLLIDAAGDDLYEGKDVAQGSVLGGVGVLIDRAGNDRYRGDRRVQGQAVGGVGVLIDRAGNDDYHAALLAQGVGGPRGFGLLDDLEGDDRYYAGGKYDGGYDDSPGYGSWSQGVGVGPRGTANGGIGVILDGGGDDLYEFDYFGHGGGYWFAAGFARDFGGNDRRGATLKAFDGSERTDPKRLRFIRWGVGYGCHYAAGFLFDDGGDDVYGGDHGTTAFAWDIAIGVICDASGNDRYEAAGSNQGIAANAGLAVLFDGGGDDTYLGNSQGTASGTMDYHLVEQAGGNFSFFIDEGGNDTYGEGLQNGVELERGWPGGFFIDR